MEAYGRYFCIILASDQTVSNKSRIRKGPKTVMGGWAVNGSVALCLIRAMCSTGVV